MGWGKEGERGRGKGERGWPDQYETRSYGSVSIQYSSHSGFILQVLIAWSPSSSRSL